MTSKDDTRLKLGTRVRLVGLEKSKEHNGKEGIVRKYDERKKRYVVETKIGGNNQCFALKRENVRVIDGNRSRAAVLEARCTASAAAAASEMKENKYTCFACGKPPTKKLMQCSVCHSVKYCSVDCQRKDWKRHKPTCKVLRDEKLQDMRLQQMINATARMAGGPGGLTTVVDDSQCFLGRCRTPEGSIYTHFQGRDPSYTCRCYCTELGMKMKSPETAQCVLVTFRPEQIPSGPRSEIEMFTDGKNWDYLESSVFEVFGSQFKIRAENQFGGNLHIRLKEVPTVPPVPLDTVRGTSISLSYFFLKENQAGDVGFVLPPKFRDATGERLTIPHQANFVMKVWCGCGDMPILGTNEISKMPTIRGEKIGLEEASSEKAVIAMVLVVENHGKVSNSEEFKREEMRMRAHGPHAEQDPSATIPMCWNAIASGRAYLDRNGTLINFKSLTGKFGVMHSPMRVVKAPKERRGG